MRMTCIGTASQEDSFRLLHGVCTAYNQSFVNIIRWVTRQKSTILCPHSQPCLPANSRPGLVCVGKPRLQVSPSVI